MDPSLHMQTTVKLLAKVYKFFFTSNNTSPERLYNMKVKEVNKHSQVISYPIILYLEKEGEETTTDEADEEEHEKEAKKIRMRRT